MTNKGSLAPEKGRAASDEALPKLDDYPVYAQRRIGTIDNIGVLQDYRRRGIGRSPLYADKGLVGEAARRPDRAFGRQRQSRVDGILAGHGRAPVHSVDGGSARLKSAPDAAA